MFVLNLPTIDLNGNYQDFLDMDLQKAKSFYQGINPTLKEIYENEQPIEDEAQREQVEEGRRLLRARVEKLWSDVIPQLITIQREIDERVRRHLLNPYQDISSEDIERLEDLAGHLGDSAVQRAAFMCLIYQMNNQ